MFDLLDRPLVYIPVTIGKLVEDGNGAAIEKRFTIEVQAYLMDRAEYNQWTDDSAKEFDDPVAGMAHEIELFRRAVKNWRKIKMGNNTPEFSDDNIALLLKVPGFNHAFAETYRSALIGKLETREGN